MPSTDQVIEIGTYVLSYYLINISAMRHLDLLNERISSRSSTYILFNLIQQIEKEY
mgnify:CR=1 FL=1